MDSEYTYQPQYVWKQTTLDGLLPVANYKEEVKEDELKKRGKAKDKSKQIGVITRFNEEGMPVEGASSDSESEEREAGDEEDEENAEDEDGERSGFGS